MKDRALAPEEVAAWHAWKLAGEAVQARIARELTAEAGLSGPDFGVLSRLVDLGEGELRQQALADAMRWDKSRLSHQLTRMESRGLVRRRPESARVVYIAITAAGRKALARARPVHARAIRTQLLARVGEPRLPDLVAILQDIARD